MPLPSVVCIGAGTGQAQILLALSASPLHLTALVGVTDNGGHSGVLRERLGIPAVGDVRRCLAAVAGERNPLLRSRLQNGVSLGNLLLAALLPKTGSLSNAVDFLQNELVLRHRILPVSDHAADICAELSDGRIVRGEWQILRRKPRTPLRRLFHAPTIPAHPEAVSSILRADWIIICPGALFTGVVSALLPRGIRRALRTTRARMIGICNIMTQAGQTDGFSVRDHLKALNLYAGRMPEFFLVNSKRPPRRWLDRYRRLGAFPVRDDGSLPANVRIVRGDFLHPPHPGLRDRSGIYAREAPHLIRHDPRVLARILRECIDTG